MIYHRTCSFSLSHLTQFKQNELHTTYQFFQEAGQHYIQALAQLTPNLVLHNQSVPKDQQIQKLHGNTKALYQPEHISSRWASKISKQAYETLLSIDSKPLEQVYVKTHSKRKSKLPKGISAPNLDGSLISIQFKTDDPLLLAKYPTHLITEKEITDKKGQLKKKIIKTPTKVSAFTSEQWLTQFGLVEFDMVIRLSRIRGQAIKHSDSILIIPLKQHAHFLQWLTQPNSKLLDCVVLNQTPLRKGSKAKPLTKKERHNRLNIHLCFECTQPEIPTVCNVINISERSCSSIGTYEVSGSQASHLALKKYLKTVSKESIYGLDVGHCKLGVLTNQDEASQESQAKSFFIGVDHPDRMTEKGEVLYKYRKAVSLNQKKSVSAKPEHVPYQSQMRAEQAKDKQYITTTLKKLFQERQASSEPIKVLVMENLNKIKIGGSGKTSLGKKFNKRNALWVVRQVQSWVVHYCQQNGILCVLVGPRFTSKQCPLCRIVPELSKKSSNRSGESYLCRCCTKETFDADYVGAHNIRQRLLFWMKMGSMPFQSKRKAEEVKSESNRKGLKQNSGSPAPLSIENHTIQ